MNEYFICLQPAPEKPRVEPKKFVKIGRPGYRVTKQREPESAQQSLLFQIDYPGRYTPLL
jgi:splicing factor 3A subunit 2